MEDIQQDPAAAEAAAQAAAEAAAQAAAEEAAQAAAAQAAAVQAYINDQVQERVTTLGNHLMAQLQARPSGSTKPSKPTPYDGRSDPELWLFSLRLYYAAADITSDVPKIAFADALLRGDALIWRRSLDYVVETWDEWKALLVTAFQPINPVEGARDRLASLRQTGSVRAYASVFRNVALQIPKITDDEKKDRFVRGLKPKIYHEIKIKDPRDFEEAVRLAVKLDSYDTSWRPKAEPSRTSYRGVSSSYPEPMDVDINAISPEPFDPRAAAAIRSIGSNPRAAIRSANALSRPTYRDAANGNGGARTSPGTSQRPGPALRPMRQPLTDRERAEFREKGLCFKCRRKGHVARECPENSRRL